MTQSLFEQENEFMPYGYHIASQMAAKLNSNKEELIKSALSANGIDILDVEFLKENISIILIEGDEYEHYYYKHGTPDEKRLISFLRLPKAEFEDSDEGVTKIVGTINYY